jgi:hypothetical protein
LLYLNKVGKLPALNEIWAFAVFIPLLSGVFVTLGAGGAAMWKRIAGAALCGAAIGVLGTVISAVIAPVDSIGISEIAVNCLWRAFVFTLLSVVAVLFTEIKLPAPKAG